MATETSKTTGTEIAPRTLEHPPESFYPDPADRSSPSNAGVARPDPRTPSGTGRILAAWARWFLVVLLVLVAPVGLIAWSVAPRVTSPVQLADEAIDSGLTTAVRTALVDKFSTDLAESDSSRVEADDLRPIVVSVLSQEWLDEQLTSVAGEFERWLDTSSADPPDLVVDLTPVKGSIVESNQALGLVAEGIDCGEPLCAAAEVVLAGMLVDVPDEVEFLTIGDESDNDPTRAMLDARDTIQTARSLIRLIPLVVIAALTAVVLLAPRGIRLRWLGAALVAIATPILAVVTLLPGWAAERAVESIEGEIPLETALLEDVFGWVAHPAGFVAWLLLAVGLVALGTSITLGVRGRRLV